ncbi:MAG: adenylyltransferase/cytidyltransferase family protein [Patescibacteria group bacterium]
MRVLIFGTFDNLHPGHRFVLGEAMKMGETHVVIARDNNVEHIKGKLPRQNEKERLMALQHAFPDVHARLGDTDDFLSPVRAIKPDLILLGYDQKLPPGLSETDLPCPVERLAAFEPDRWKSSLRK